MARVTKSPRSVHPPSSSSEAIEGCKTHVPSKSRKCLAVGLWNPCPAFLPNARAAYPGKPRKPMPRSPMLRLDWQAFPTTVRQMHLRFPLASKHHATSGQDIKIWTRANPHYQCPFGPGYVSGRNSAQRTPVILWIPYSQVKLPIVKYGKHPCGFLLQHFLATVPS